MQATMLTPKQQADVRAQVAAFLGTTRAFGGLTPQQRTQVLADTEKVVSRLAEGRASPDPYAGLSAGQDWAGAGRVATTPGQVGQIISGGAKGLIGKQMAPTGSIIDVGVQEAAKMIREIDFPAFVAKLI